MNGYETKSTAANYVDEAVEDRKESWLLKARKVIFEVEHRFSFKPILGTYRWNIKVLELIDPSSLLVVCIVAISFSLSRFAVPLYVKITPELARV